MLKHSTKLSRAESARINGAKSKGPKTPEGLHRSRTASYKNGLYAVRNYMLPGESNLEYAEIQTQLVAYWQPKSFFDHQLVEELVGHIWEMKRMQAVKNDYLHDCLITVANAAPHLTDQAKLNLEAVKLSCVANGTADRAHAQLAHHARERDRIERRLLRLEKRSCTSGPSQMSLKINNRQNPELPATSDAKPVDGLIAECPYVVEAGDQPAPETFPVTEPVPEHEPANDILNWADEALDFQPDPIQAQILTADNPKNGSWMKRTSCVLAKSVETERDERREAERDRSPKG